MSKGGRKCRNRTAFRLSSPKLPAMFGASVHHGIPLIPYISIVRFGNDRGFRRAPVTGAIADSGRGTQAFREQLRRRPTPLARSYERNAFRLPAVTPVWEPEGETDSDRRSRTRGTSTRRRREATLRGGFSLKRQPARRTASRGRTRQAHSNRCERAPAGHGPGGELRIDHRFRTPAARIPVSPPNWSLAGVRIPFPMR